MMPILSLQRRARELGRIRIGQVTKGANGKVRPSKLDTFRLTSHSQALIAKVAELYGGTAVRWTPQGGGPDGWEVVTESTRLPVLVPPQPVSQYFELWAGSGCTRRCDGETELLSDSPCKCSPEADERECKPTTRLNVILRDVEGIGVWRLESKGYSAAAELPDVADFLAQSRGYIEGFLSLEERVSKKDGQTRRFMVPTIEVNVTPSQLMAGHGAQQLAGPVPAQLSGPAPRAIEAPPADVAPQPDSVRDALMVVSAHGTLDDLRALWGDAKTAGLESLALEIAAEFKARSAASVQRDVEVSGDPDALWMQIMQAVPVEWSTTKTEEDFETTVGRSAESADAADMTKYLTHLAVTS